MAIADRIVTWLVLPLVGPQALWVKWRAAALPAPSGALAGVSGSGPDLQLMIAGDSSALGTGAPDQASALSGGLLRRLGPTRRVHWTVEAKSGDTARDLLARIEALPSRRLDIAVLSIGINDAKNGVREWLWRRRMIRALDILQDRFGARLICLSGLPPVGQFPLLPMPLRWVMARRVARFDRGLARIAADRPNCIYVPLDVTIEPDKMAADGFHAGPEMYAIWAGMLFDAIRDKIPQPRVGDG
ncbi:SGNH/GDSL hydrolase family protein [Ponticoccus sp. SC2-23]|uniref:SGNH/GDSL hydrolase family protein n=1 Tax=Alexandriicola marinus TaxID=2081710 RepID=UPI000FD71CBD|nr:SGNH/GDSL hydrolase family protein [Alexandriicola marinus]MBM1220118.1 SGNH/GDSL hydrolase family protein [Ponticoccus sp. SC6-9]MBM1224804.1 SGNH/GDSL hydrolase family protein [Ponticoccus sp. SC6-15]MBM1228317.1 SGNH/GDSL hydrolase family protein [Ponticoccus sp. SC6-38]MBM1234045.1 SGNH/GDSL hydrolase family protein [Ponticoccus sp. SC6-45]MBM1238819.1 SGNH/GDSL hydrolase family protein [Ponticoccus sp. SC6-49]MBM1242600.1 SGNH/GDSL hydrolase family protein [Ponticoccus sp. SC2-64]MBM